MDYSRVFKNSGFFMISGILPQLVGFIMLPIYSRFLTPSDYGIVALINSFNSFLPILFSLKIPGSIGRFFFFFKGKDLHDYISSVYTLVIIIAGITLGGIYFFIADIIQFVFPKTPGHFIPLFELSLFTVFFSTITSISTALLKVQERAKLFMKLSIFLFTVSLCINIVEIIVLKRGALGVIEAAFWGSVITLVVYLIPNFKYLRPKLRLELLGEPIKYSLPIIPHAVSGLVFMYSDRIILEKFVPLGMVGLYFFADKISFLFKQLINQFNTAYQPNFMKVASEDKAKAKDGAKYLSKIFISMMIILIVVSSLFIGEIFYFLFDLKFFGASQFVPILAAAYVFRALYVFSTSGLFFEKKTNLVAVITLVAGIVNIMINLIFIPVFGTLVAAISTFLSFLVTYLMAEVISRKYFYLPILNKELLWLLVYMLITLCIGYTLNERYIIGEGTYTFFVFLLKIVILIAGGFLLYKTKFFSDIKGLIKRGAVV